MDPPPVDADNGRSDNSDSAEDASPGPPPSVSDSEDDVLNSTTHAPPVSISLSIPEDDDLGEVEEDRPLVVSAGDGLTTHRSTRERKKWKHHYQRKYLYQRKKLKEWEARLMAKEQNLLVLEAKYKGIDGPDRLRRLNAMKPSEYQRAQTIMRNCSFRMRWERKLLPMFQRRIKAIREIYDTEAVYVQALITLREAFQKPMQKEGILTEDQSERVFSNTNDILDVQKPFLRSLLELKKHHEDARPLERILADFFNAPLMDAYVQYISNYDDNRDYITALKAANKDFATRLEKSEKESNGSTIGSYLIRPVQRLPRYKILLQEILKHTHKEHPAKEALQQVMKTIQKTLKSIDRAKGRKDAVKRFHAAKANQRGMNKSKADGSGEESKLLVCVYSAKDLRGSIAGADCFFTVEVEGAVGRTQPKSPPAPIYEKDFAFYVEDSSGVVDLKCYQNGVVPTKLGSLRIPLSDVAHKYSKQDEHMFKLRSEAEDCGGSVTLKFDWIPGKKELRIRKVSGTKGSDSSPLMGVGAADGLRAHGSAQVLSRRSGTMPGNGRHGMKPPQLCSSNSAENVLRSRHSGTLVSPTSRRGASPKYAMEMTFPMLLTVSVDHVQQSGDGISVKKGLTVVATEYNDGRFFVSCDSVGAGWLPEEVCTMLNFGGSGGGVGGRSLIGISEEDSESEFISEMSETSEYHEEEYHHHHHHHHHRKKGSSLHSRSVRVSKSKRRHASKGSSSYQSDSSSEESGRTETKTARSRKGKKKWYNTIKKQSVASTSGQQSSKHTRRGSLEGPNSSADNLALSEIFIPPARDSTARKGKKKGKKKGK